jgi:hypothetical protein
MLPWMESKYRRGSGVKITEEVELKHIAEEVDLSMLP